MAAEAAKAGDTDYEAFFAADQINYYSRGDHAAAAQRLADGIGHPPQADGGRNSFLLRNLGVYYSQIGDEDAAIIWFDKVLAKNPKDSLAHQQAAIAELRAGRSKKVFERMTEAVKLEPKRWRGNFTALCKILGKEPIDEWTALFPPPSATPAKSGSAVALPTAAPGVTEPVTPGATSGEMPGAKTEPPEGELMGMGMYIEWLRNSLKDERIINDKAIDTGKAIRTDFLRGASLLVEGRSMFLVLRRWHSYSPAIPSVREEPSGGGGYCLWHQERGTVIR